ncbi:MAG: hypothetical protein V1892_01910 [bacterium]
MGQFKKIILANIVTLVLALISILLERKFGTKLLWVSFVFIAAFIITIIWAIIIFLIRAFK